MDVKEKVRLILVAYRMDYPDFHDVYPTSEAFMKISEDFDRRYVTMIMDTIIKELNKED